MSDVLYFLGDILEFGMYLGVMTLLNGMTAVVVFLLLPFKGRDEGHLILAALVSGALWVLMTCPEMIR